MTISTSDIVIIGGGIIGNAIADYLSKKTKLSILVIEQNMLCSGSTTLAGSLITRLRDNTSLIPLISETCNAVSEIIDSEFSNIGEQRVGCMHVATSHSAVTKLEELKRIAIRFNIAADFVDGDFLCQKVPWIKSEMIKQALFVPDDFYVDGVKLGMTYARMARKKGAKYLMNEPVSEILVKKDKIEGVRLNGEIIHTPVVIVATGIWSNLLLEKLNTKIPAVPVRSIYFLTKAKKEYFPENHPMCVIPDAKAFSKPSNGALLFGIRDSNSSFVRPNLLPRRISYKKYIYADEIWHILKNEAAELCNLINNSACIEISSWVAAPCSYTYDGNPVIGKISGIDGLFAATGCNGGGIAASAGFGRLVAEMVLGEKTFVPADAFSPSRFKGDVYSDEFMQLCSAQRSRKISG